VDESQEDKPRNSLLDDIVDAWFQGWNKVRGETYWADLVEDFWVRFSEKPTTDTIEEFNKFKQEGLVIDYQVRFEELRSL